MSLFKGDLGFEGPKILVWKNKPSLFLGRNQIPWHELNLSKVLQDQVPIIRRFSGGGTVYHDLGNINISFLDGASKGAHFDLLKKTFSDFDIEVEIGNRGEITTQGYKISGTAYYHYQGKTLHHLTMLFNADLDALWQYLNPSLTAHKTRAVVSVRQPVANISTLYPQLRAEEFLGRLAQRARLAYRLDDIKGLLNQKNQSPASGKLEEMEALLKSWKWLYGNTPEFEAHVNFLGQPLALSIKDGMLAEIRGNVEGSLRQVLNQRLHMPFVIDQWQSQDLRLSPLRQ